MAGRLFKMYSMMILTGLDLDPGCVVDKGARGGVVTTTPGPLTGVTGGLVLALFAWVWT